MAPAGAGMPVKKLPAQAGRFGSSIITLKRGEPQRGADREHHGGDPAGRFELVQAPEIEDQRRRDAEIDEVGEAVELGAEARRALEHARDAPVDAVEHRREHDRGQRPSRACPSTASRMAVRPAHSASSVMRLGTSVRTGIARKRARRSNRPAIEIEGRIGTWGQYSRLRMAPPWPSSGELMNEQADHQKGRQALLLSCPDRGSRIEASTGGSRRHAAAAFFHNPTEQLHPDAVVAATPGTAHRE